MAIPAPEYREQLLAQGCAEGLADAIVSLVEAARDDAEAEVIIKVGERVAHSEQQLNGRLDQHVEQNDQQFRDADSAVRESARELTDQINQRAAEIKLEVAQTLQTVADLRVENERQFADLRAKNESQFADLRVENERQFAKMQAENERQFAKMQAENERQFAKMQVESERRHAEIEKALAEKETADERRFNKGQERLLYAAIGLAGLIVGAAAAVIAAVAFPV